MGRRQQLHRPRVPVCLLYGLFACNPMPEPSSRSTGNSPAESIAPKHDPGPKYDPLSTTERHFVVGNETRHDIFYPYIRDRGGAYLGVGSEQNYSLIAASSASLAFIVDIDARVLDYHRILITLVKASPTPADLLRRFSAADQDQVRAIFAVSTNDQQAAFTLWKSLRARVSRHLQTVATRPYPTWLADPKMYQHIRTLCLQDQLFVMPGDLQGTATLRSIGELTRARSTPIRTVYLSNAEESLTDIPQFAANLQALDGPKAVVLRTLFRPQWDAADGLWSYQIHRLDDLQHRLKMYPQANLTQIIDAAQRDGQLRVVRGDHAVTTIGFPNHHN